MVWAVSVGLLMPESACSLEADGNVDDNRQELSAKVAAETPIPLTGLNHTYKLSVDNHYSCLYDLLYVKETLC